MGMFSKRPIPGQTVPQPASLEAVESSSHALRGQRTELEDRLAKARADEAEAHAEVSAAEDALLAGVVDTEALEAARGRVALAYRAVTLITDELATVRRLCERAEAMVATLRKEAEERRRDEWHHRYLRKLRELKSPLAMTMVLMSQLQRIYDECLEQYPRDVRPGPPDLLLLCSPIWALSACGTTRASDFLKALAALDPPSVSVEVEEALEMVKAWDREQAAATARREAMAAARYLAPRFAGLEATVTIVREGARPERTLEAVQPAYPDRHPAIPVFNRTR